jgi:hypothetical protein
MTIGIFVLFALVAIHYTDFNEISARFDSLATKQSDEVDVSSRIFAHRAATDMLKAQGLRGVGAGCFRYLFPDYVKNYPAIYQNGQLLWLHAHCDWLEIPIELGLAGSLIVLGGAVWWIAWFVRQRVLWNPLAMVLLFGCFQTLVHAGFDFPFQCPAILATWCVLLTVAGRWAELERGV